MANEHKIEINKRENVGKKLVKQMRKMGNIPGVYYSPTSKESISISVSQSEFLAAIKSRARIFNISVGGEKQNVLFKSIQYHPVTDEVLHIDLYGINMNNPINIKIPIKLIGNPIGVSEDGGVLNQPINEIEIQCLPSDIPEFLEYDISDLSLGDSVNVGNMELDDKLSLITLEETVLASITHAMKEIEPVVEVDEDETFLDEEGEPSEEGAGGDKDGETQPVNENRSEKGEGSE